MLGSLFSIVDCIETRPILKDTINLVTIWMSILGHGSLIGDVALI